ncbi:hypothetical protein CHC07_05266 [Variovorax sp. B4]|nr:hypothetical protein CHC07_05266 [Variovorax sp. B4]PNG55426.1 hypothetical protein CHC06_04229 [Variovorax sp. B2]
MPLRQRGRRLHAEGAGGRAKRRALHARADRGADALDGQQEPRHTGRHAGTVGRGEAARLQHRSGIADAGCDGNDASHRGAWPSRLGIQQFIISNTTAGGGTDGVPPWAPYTVSRDATAPINTSSVASIARCANGDLSCISGVGMQQNPPLTAQQQQAVGAYFGKMSTDYQRAAALATATGNVPVTLSFEIAAGIAGLLEQAFTPSTGKVVIDSFFVDEAAKRLSTRTGIPLIVVMEVAEREIKPRLQDARNLIDDSIRRGSQ